jgi:peroxiredoxin Q/BCP
MRAACRGTRWFTARSAGAPAAWPARKIKTPLHSGPCSRRNIFLAGLKLFVFNESVAVHCQEGFQKPLQMLGKPVSDFSLPSTGGSAFRLSSTHGSKVVLYFYPKDNTPGCTTEGADFRDRHKDFRRANCQVFGISRDSVKSHENFKSKMGFPFELLSDAEEAVCSQFGVMKTKNMYGRKVRGIERSTFVLDEKGVLAREWRGVKVPGHIEEVLNFVKAL